MEVGGPLDANIGITGDNYDEPWLGRVLGYVDGFGGGEGSQGVSNAGPMMLATLKTNGRYFGDVVVNMQGQVVATITWQKVNPETLPLVQPSPYRVTQALLLQDALGNGNIVQTVAKWTGNPKL